VRAFLHPRVDETQYHEAGTDGTPLRVALIERRELFEEREMSERSIGFEHCSLRWKADGPAVVPHDCAAGCGGQVWNRDDETSDL
jgi:hypothetical protein